MVNCSTLDVQQWKIDDLQTQFYNEVQSAGLELMNEANALVGWYECKCVRKVQWLVQCL